MKTVYKTMFLVAVFLLSMQLNPAAGQDPEAAAEEIEAAEEEEVAPQAPEKTEAEAVPKAAPGVAVAVEEPESIELVNLQRPIPIPTWPVSKKYKPFMIPLLVSTIIGWPDTSFGLTLGKILRKFLAFTNTRHVSDDAAFNLELVDRKINRNFGVTMKLMKMVMTKEPDAGKYFKISKHGFSCDEKFCTKYGKGHHTMGICSPYSCICSDNGGEGQRCFKGMVYDPIYQDCDYPNKVKICGF